MSPSSEASSEVSRRCTRGGVVGYLLLLDRLSWGILGRRFPLQLFADAVVELRHHLVQGRELLHAPVPGNLLELSDTSAELVQLVLEGSQLGGPASPKQERPSEKRKGAPP